MFKVYFKGWNFNLNSLKNLQDMKKAYPDQPLFVGEYWSGWFDNWGGRHNTQNITYFTQQFQQIVFQMNSSINLYMFFGGTNYGFMAGNVGKPDPGALTASVITSYDYDAPLSESGLGFLLNFMKNKLTFFKAIIPQNTGELKD